jgi:phosphoketolase
MSLIQTSPSSTTGAVGKLLVSNPYINKNGKDLPEICKWKWK